MKTINKDMVIGDILKVDREKISPILMNMGMNCLGCPGAQSETLENACMIHGVNVNDIENQINTALNN